MIAGRRGICERDGVSAFAAFYARYLVRCVGADVPIPAVGPPGMIHVVYFGDTRVMMAVATPSLAFIPMAKTEMVHTGAGLSTSRTSSPR